MLESGASISYAKPTLGMLILNWPAIYAVYVVAWWN